MVALYEMIIFNSKLLIKQRERFRCLRGGWTVTRGSPADILKVMAWLVMGRKMD